MGQVRHSALVLLSRRQRGLGCLRQARLIGRYALYQRTREPGVAVPQEAPHSLAVEDFAAGSTGDRSD